MPLDEAAATAVFLAVPGGPLVLAVILLDGGLNTLAAVARRCAGPALLEIHSGRFPRADVPSFLVRAGLMVTGVATNMLPRPASSAVVLVSRGDDLLSPPRDHVYVLWEPRGRPVVRLLFGHEGGDET